MPITADAREMQADLARFRHELHREPEIGLELPRTQEKVLKALDGLGYEITLGQETTSVTAVLRGGAHSAGTRPAVLLRATAFSVQMVIGLYWLWQFWHTGTAG